MFFLAREAEIDIPIFFHVYAASLVAGGRMGEVESRRVFLNTGIVGLAKKAKNI